MGQISLSIPATGQPDTTEDVKIQNDFTAIQNVINGNVDATNVTAALAQSAAVNQSGQTVKGAVNIAASESRTNVAYGTLPTPDQVTGIVLPSNGLIAVWYQATWQESVSQGARAAIFIGANEAQVEYGNAAPQTQAACMNVAAQVNTNRPLMTGSVGILSLDTATVAYTADVTTGQIIGAPINSNSSTKVTYEIGGFAKAANSDVGGPCYLFAAAGTYTVSVQFKASSGSVTASNRKLWVQALSFA